MASRNVLLKMVADVTGAKAGIAETTHELKKFGSYTAEATVKLQTEGVQAKLDKLNAQLKRYGEQPHTADVKIRMGNVARQIERAEVQLKALGSAGEQAGAKAAGGLRVAGLASDRLSHKLREHRSEFVGFAKGAVGLTAAFSAITDARSAVETTDEIAKATLILGRNFGFTAEEASKWAVVAQSRDVDPTALSTGFTRLSRAVEQARAGSKPYQETFKQLGITNAELIRGQHDFPFLIGRVTEAFSHLSGGTRRASIAQQVFGRGSRGLLLLLRQGSQGFDAQSKMAAKYGATLNEKTLGGVEKLVVAQRQAHYATTGLQIAFGTGLAPALTRVTRRISAFILGMRNGTGAGGRFAHGLRTVVNDARPVVAAIAAIVRTVARIPHALTLAIAAWALFRISAVRSLVATRLGLMSTVLRIGLLAPAIAGAEGATVTGFAAMRVAALSMLGPLGAVLAAVVAVQEAFHPGGDARDFDKRIRNFQANLAAAQDKARVDPRLAGFPDGGASTANGRPSAAGRGRPAPTIKTTAQILAGLGSSKQISARSLNLGVAQARRAYVKAVRKYGANSAQAIQAAADLDTARTSLHDFEHPDTSAARRAAAARRRRRRRASQQAAAANPDATPQDIATEHAAQHYADVVRRYGAGSPQAIRARDEGNVKTARATIQTITAKMVADLRKYGSGSQRVARDRTALARAQARLTTATQQLTKAVKKNTDQNAALLPRLTDVAYHPISGRMQHTPTRHGLGAAGHVHNETTVQVTTPGGIQYPDAEGLAAVLQRKLAAKGNG